MNREINKVERKNPRNVKGQPHGEWFIFDNNPEVHNKGTFINGVKVGYWENYFSRFKSTNKQPRKHTYYLI